MPLKGILNMRGADIFDVVSGGYLTGLDQVLPFPTPKSEPGDDGNRKWDKSTGARSNSACACLCRGAAVYIQMCCLLTGRSDSRGY